MVKKLRLRKVMGIQLLSGGQDLKAGLPGLSQGLRDGPPHVECVAGRGSPFTPPPFSACNTGGSGPRFGGSRLWATQALLPPHFPAGEWTLAFGSGLPAPRGGSRLLAPPLALPAGLSLPRGGGGGYRALLGPPPGGGKEPVSCARPRWPLRRPQVPRCACALVAGRGEGYVSAGDPGPALVPPQDWRDSEVAEGGSWCPGLGSLSC